MFLQQTQKYEERVAIKVVNCPPSVEVSINRPDTKYQLGFSVQNGMVCLENIKRKASSRDYLLFMLLLLDLKVISTFYCNICCGFVELRTFII